MTYGLLRLKCMVRRTSALGHDGEFMFSFNTKELVFDSECNKEVVINNICKEKEISDELNRYLDGDSNINEE